MPAKNLILILYFCFLNVNAQSKADQVLGNWLATDGSVAVGVYKSNGEYKARILWFDASKGSGKPMHARLDYRNPDPKLRKRKIIGMEILHGLVYNAQHHVWERGRIYDASSGRFWDSSVHLTGDGLLKVRGFWKLSWIGKSMTFKKTNHPKFTKL